MSSPPSRPPSGPPLPGGSHAHAVPSPYGQPAPAPYAPVQRQERPLLPGVWWSLVLNLVVTVLLGVVVLLLGWAFVGLLTSVVGQDVGWREAVGGDDVAAVVVVVVLAMVASVLVSWLLTVAALVLWRLVRGFRTIPAFLQALIAWSSMLVVTSIVSFLAQVVLGVVGAFTGASTY